MPAVATMLRPGSTRTTTPDGRPAVAARIAPAHSAMVGADSSPVYATPSPPPRVSSGSPVPANSSTITRLAFSNSAADITFDPMWQCRPTRFTEDAERARAIAACASPFARLKPNFESSWPVETYSCVWACTPGVIRRWTSGTGRPDACRRSRRSSSSKLSTTMWSTPAVTAWRSSSSDLLFPCTVHTDAGTPAESTACSSPPVATSSRRPSSWARRAIAPHRNALVA